MISTRSNAPHIFFQKVHAPAPQYLTNRAVRAAVKKLCVHYDPLGNRTIPILYVLSYAISCELACTIRPLQLAHALSTHCLVGSHTWQSRQLLGKTLQPEKACGAHPCLVCWATRRVLWCPLCINVHIILRHRSPLHRNAHPLHHLHHLHRLSLICCRSNPGLNCPLRLCVSRLMTRASSSPSG